MGLSRHVGQHVGYIMVSSTVNLFSLTLEQLLMMPYVLFIAFAIPAAFVSLENMVVTGFLSNDAGWCEAYRI